VSPASGPIGPATTGRRCCTPTRSVTATAGHPALARNSPNRPATNSTGSAAPRDAASTSPAATHGDHEPIRALLTHVAGGALGIDRPRAALDDLDKALHYEAWARTELIFGTDEQRAPLPARLEQLTRHVDAVLAHLATVPAPANTATKPTAGTASR